MKSIAEKDRSHGEFRRFAKFSRRKIMQGKLGWLPDKTLILNIRAYSVAASQS